MAENPRAIKLDLKDRKIITELDSNCRIPFVQLGKKVGLSSASVEKRVRALVKNGIILKFNTLIDYGLLGYTTCLAIITLRNMPADKKLEFAKWLDSEPLPCLVNEIAGRYDFLIATSVMNLHEFCGFADKLRSIWGDHIKAMKTCVITESEYYPIKSLVERTHFARHFIRDTEKRIRLDETDMKILKIIMNAARTPLMKIAEEVGESPKVVAYRIKRLEKEGLILRYKIFLNLHALGLTEYYLHIKLEKPTREIRTRIKENLCRNSFAIRVHEGIEMEGDISIHLATISTNDIIDLIDELKQKFPSFIGEYFFDPIVSMPKFRSTKFW